MPVYRTLIVDDHREVRRVLRSAIETLGPDFKVTDVPSGEEAILVISRQPVDLLVSDIRLPGISGLELKERAAVRNPDLRHILITGMTDPKVHAQMMNANPDAYFIKPVPIDEFLEAVRACLGVGLDGEPEPVYELAALIPPVVVSAPMAAPIRPIAAPAAPEPAAETPAIEAPDLADVVAEIGPTPRLARLRRELDAVCVALLDEGGQFTAMAGSIPEEVNEGGLISASLTAFGAGTRLANLLGQSPPTNLMVYTGQLYDLYLLHIGTDLGLLGMSAAAVWDARRFGEVFQITRSATQDILTGLKEMGMDLGEPVEAPTSAALPEAAPEAADAGLLADLDLIFGQVQAGGIRRTDADAFWDTAVPGDGEQIERADVISFDQARQLGLAPDEK